MDTNHELITTLNNIEAYSDNNQPYYGWYIRGNSDYVLNMGKMKKAIIVQQLFGGKYSVAVASFFAFPDVMYNLRFDTPKEAVVESSTYIAKWMEESIKNLWI